MIRPRRGLPTSRSVVGGLLVALAAVVAWTAAAGSTAAPTTRYVVTTRALGPGERIEPEHLTTVAMELPDAQRRGTYSDPASVTGRIVLGPLGPGELVQATALAPAPPDGGGELTFPVAPTWAVGGRLVAGDRIDVYATYGDGASSQTLRVLAGATVRRVDGGATDRLGDAGRQSITVALGAEVAPAPVVNAVQSAEITVIRTTGSEAAGELADLGASDPARYDARADLEQDPADDPQAANGDSAP